MKARVFLFGFTLFVLLFIGLLAFATPTFAGDGNDCQGRSCEDVPGHECEHGKHVGNPHCDSDDDEEEDDDDGEDRDGEDDDEDCDDDDGDNDDDCPPTPSPTKTVTSPPPTLTNTPQPTATATPTPTATATNTPLPTATATPTVEPPAPTPTPTPPPTEEPEEEVTKVAATEPEVCREADVKVKVRLNTDTQIANIWRIWVDDATGRMTDELLLTDHVLLDDSTNLFPSIGDDCWVYISSWAKGEENADLWRVSVYGAQNGIYRMTNTPDVSELHPDATLANKIHFDASGQVYETNRWGTNTTFLFDGEVPIVSPDGEKITYVLDGFVHIWDGKRHSNTGYSGFPIAWEPKGVGLFLLSEGVLQMFNFASGELELVGAWSDYAPDPRELYFADIGEMFEQVWWVMPETEMLLTGEVPGQSLGEFSAQAAEQVEEMNRMPDWWVRASDRAEFNSALVDAYLDRLAEQANAESVTGSELPVTALSPDASREAFVNEYGELCVRWTFQRTDGLPQQWCTRVLTDSVVSWDANWIITVITEDVTYETDQYSSFLREASP